MPETKLATEGKIRQCLIPSFSHHSFVKVLKDKDVKEKADLRPARWVSTGTAFVVSLQVMDRLLQVGTGPAACIRRDC